MNLLISGYYGFNNLGDELILRSIISELHLKNKDISITVLSANPAKTGSLYKVNSINRWNPYKIIKEITRSQVIVLGGGGLFQDMTSSLSLYYYLLVMFLAKLFCKKLFVYSVNINELAYFNRLLASFMLKKADMITVREKTSLQVLEKWSVDLKKAELTADPVFLNENIKFNKLKNVPRIAMCLRDPGDERFINEFAELAKKLSGYFHGEVVFIPFHPDKDLRFIVKVAKKAGPGNYRILEWESIEDILNIYSWLDLVICQRLHSMVLAVLFGIPFVAISEDEKIINMAGEIDKDLVLPLKSLRCEEVFDLAVKIYGNRDKFQDNTARILPLLRQRAKRASELLINLI